MLILTSRQVFHALKTVSLLVTARGIISAAKPRPNIKNNLKKKCSAENGKLVCRQTNGRIRNWGIATQHPGNGTQVLCYQNTGGSKMNNSSGTLHSAFDSETGARLQASQP